MLWVAGGNPRPPALSDNPGWINNILSIFEKKNACWIVSGVNERNSLPL